MCRDVGASEWQAFNGGEAHHTAKKYDVVNTADQQLYRVVLHLTWGNPDLCDMFLRLGGMHFLMSYIGSLMAQIGLEEVPSEQFGWVKMMIGKKFPENVCAFRLLLEELL